MRPSTLNNSEVRACMAMLIVAMLGNILLILAVTNLITVQISAWTACGGVLITTLIASWFFLIRLDRMLRWDRALGSISVGEDGELNANLLHQVFGSSRPEHGWNKMVDMGRRWQAVKELESSIAKRLEASQSAVAFLFWMRFLTG